MECGDIFDQILSYFTSVEDALNLASCSSSLKKEVSKKKNFDVIFTYNFNRLLKSFQIHPNEFLLNINKLGARVNGGFALQCVSSPETQHKNGDIDVYLGSKYDESSTSNSLASFLRRQGYEQEEGQYLQSYKDTLIKSHYISKVRTFKKIIKRELKSIQLIFVNEEVSSVSEAHKWFDLTCCQVSMSVRSVKELKRDHVLPFLPMRISR